MTEEQRSRIIAETIIALVLQWCNTGTQKKKGTETDLGIREQDTDTADRRVNEENWENVYETEKSYDNLVSNIITILEKYKNRKE